MHYINQLYTYLLTYSRSVSAKQSGWISELMQKRVYIVQTPVCDTSRCDQRREAAPHWQMGKHVTKRRRWSSWSTEKAITCKHEATGHHWTKTGSFQSPTLHNQSRQQSTEYRWKDIVSRHFDRSYLKANKVHKSEGTRKVKYAYHFWKRADAVDQKIIKISPCLSKLQLAKVGAFFETPCIFGRYAY